MRKVVLCLFYALCAFAIAFSLFWMALPRLALPSPAPGADSAAETPVPSGPSLAAQTLPDTGQPTQYRSGTRAAWWPSTPAGRTAPPPALPG